MRDARWFVAGAFLVSSSLLSVRCFSDVSFMAHSYDFSCLSLPSSPLAVSVFFSCVWNSSKRSTRTRNRRVSTDPWQTHTTLPLTKKRSQKHSIGSGTTFRAREARRAEGFMDRQEAVVVAGGSTRGELGTAVRLAGSVFVSLSRSASGRGFRGRVPVRLSKWTMTCLLKIVGCGRGLVLRRSRKRRGCMCQR